MEKSGRVVVITGGSKGIGRAIAQKFAEENASIIILHFDPDEQNAEETLRLLANNGTEAECHRIDVSSSEAVSELFENIVERYGKIDVLINNAGITRDNLLMRMSVNDWDLVLDVNLKSVFNCTKSVMRTMLKKRSGSIVSISSIAGEIGNPGQANYSASKAGIMGFTKSIAREVASRGITVNAVAPGFIETDMTAALSEEARNDLIAQIPSKKLGRPCDVAEVVYWLASESASYITGQVIHVNGGMDM